MQKNAKKDAVSILMLVIMLCTQAIPQVTLAIVTAQVCAYMRVFPLPWSGARQACISVDFVLRKNQWKRIFYSAFEHADAAHLFYNVVSFVWKGRLLENMLGSEQFAYIVSVFTALCGVVYVGLNCLLGACIDPGFYYGCAAGFSSVIFALKVLSNHYFPGQALTFMGLVIELPTGAAVWAELLLVHLVAPGSSWVGHLAGILVGLAYVRGVIKPACDFVWSFLGQMPLGAPAHHHQHHGHQQPQPNIGLPNFAEVPFGAILMSAALAALHAGEWNLSFPCLASSLVTRYHQWQVLLLPALHSSGALHLGYTVLSLFALGCFLERQMTSVSFVAVTIAVTVLTNVAYCAVAHCVLQRCVEVAGVPGYEVPYKCFTGLTATLIAMKGLYSAYYPNSPYLFLCLQVPVPKFVGIILEVGVLHFVLPEVWIVGNVVGLVAAMFMMIVYPGPHD